MTDAPVTSHQQLALARSRQLFRFLKAFAERRVPVRRRLDEHEWRLALRELPDHPTIQVGSVRIAAAAEVEEGADAGAAAPLLRVGRPQLTPGPRPPDELLPWLERHAPDDPDARPVMRQAHARVNEHGETIAEALGDDAARAAAAAHWLAAWEAWAEHERPARAAKLVFDRFYALLGRIERESEQVELVLGDGRLRRRLADGVVDHPVLLQRVELEFDPDVPEFRVLDTDRAPELYGTVLQEENGIAGAKLHELQRELEQVGFHPLEPESTTGFLRRLAALLGPDVAFHASAGAAAAGPPSITRDAVLLLRQRSSGFPAAFDRVLADLESEPELPPSLVRVVGVETPLAAEGDDPPVAPWGEPLDVLLSKPANLEQVQIARALERHGAVLVQGPPGTGKSHTIANLIGHLVAQGKRVLVTSHTTKALRVLRGHVVPELRPLCVSLLEQDLEGRQQLEQAVRGIVERLSTAQESQLVRDIERLDAARARLIGELDRIATDLRTVREAEYVPIVVAGEAVSPADAARETVRAGSAHAWLPGPLTPGAPLPLSAADVRALHATNAELSAAEERELDADVPTLDQLPAPAELDRTVAALSATEPAELARFWRDAPAEECLPALDALGHTLQSFAGELAAMTPWQRALVEAGRDGGAERALWLTLRDKVLEAKRRHDEARELLMEHAVALSDAAAWDELREAVPEMATHVRGGGSLSALALLFRPRWKRVLAECTVNGRRPAAPVHFEAVRAHLELRREAEALAQRWNRQGAAVGLPAFEPARGQAVATLAQYAEQFEALLAWWDARWADVEARLRDAGFAWDQFREREV
ncbi:MAG TPA: AAA domain-containing protein, partial [Gemmatimonadaceae bacterium]|nr:AAA domain-containing protein [Gemmatimonadaceae bacterium]